MTIKLRRAHLPGDACEAFVFDSLRRSYLRAADGGERGDAPREFAHALVRRLSEQRDGDAARDVARVLCWHIKDALAADARLYVAFPHDDPDTFLGWVCASPGVLHYVYSKKNLRRQRLASEMLALASADLGAPLERASLMTWPWVEAWLARNMIDYSPSNGRQERKAQNEQEEQRQSAAGR